MRRDLRDPTFSRFDTIPECDGHTHRQTDTRRRHIPRLARRRAVKIEENIQYIPIHCLTLTNPVFIHQPHSLM